MPQLDDPCGVNLRFRDLIECGETQSEYRIANLPKEPASYAALVQLAQCVLDPTWKQFGPIRLTYGFCSLELLNKIASRVAPKLDQHSSHERRPNGRYICERLGAACDFLIPGRDMRDVANWIYYNTPVDRVYFYGNDRPVHVSYSENRAHQFVAFTVTDDGKRVPKVVRQP
jgi:hypothetical protein